MTTTTKGLSLGIIKKFSHADFYSSRTAPSVPGTIEIRGNGIDQKYIIAKYVIAMYSQYYPGKSNGSDTKINRQAWFKQCLDRIAVIPGLISVAFPYKIGCGMAGEIGLYMKR